jgi:hypothetical protein
VDDEAGDPGLALKSPAAIEGFRRARAYRKLGRRQRDRHAMQINLDPKQMEYLKRQAEAMEKIAQEVAKLRRTAMETQETLSQLAEAVKSAAKLGEKA